MRALLYLALAVMAGCGTVQSPPSAPERQPAPAPLPAPSASSPSEKKPESIAVAGLMQSARADAAAGRLANAAASLERAIRIEPRNARLWSELARVRFQQRDYAQAESTALRSNALAGGDAELRAINHRLIEQARAARRR